MRNYLQLLITLTFLLNHGKMYSQCPTASFSIADSGCVGSTISLTNSSLGASNYVWDFNSNDNSTIPTGAIIGNYSGFVGSSLGVDLAKEGNNFIGFSINLGGQLARYEFGPSITSTPVVTVLGPLGVLSNTVDLNIIEDNGNWYGITNSFGNQIIRIDFGSSLTNTPTATVLTISPALFNTPYYMSTKRLGDKFYSVVANYGNGSILVVDYGTTINNNNPTTYVINVPSANPIGVDIDINCDQIYAIVGYGNASPLTQISFGSTVSGTPISITNVNTASPTSLRKIKLINDGKDFLLACVDLGGTGLQTFNFGSDLSNLNPVSTVYSSVGGFGGGTFALSLFKSESTLMGLTTNYNSGEVGYYKFNESNAGLGITDTTTSPNYIFNTSGYHLVSLKAIDSITGLYSYKIDSIYINELPQVGFTTASPCEGYLTTIVDTSTIQIGSIIQNSWTLNGNTLNGDTIVYAFPSTGTYPISLTVTSDVGCSNTKVDNIFVSPNPVSVFSFSNNQCAENEITFTNNSDPVSGNFTSFHWNFGDTGFSTDSTGLHQYTTFGNFDVSLIVEANGCYDTSNQSISIIEKPVADFKAFNSCLGEVMNFANLSSISTGTINSTWDFGDGNISSINNPTNNYLSTGFYNVSLISLASNGCVDTSIQEIHIGNPPTPSFTLSRDTACTDNDIIFTDASFPALGDTIIARYWDFGDGSVDSLNVNPVYSYSNPGTYTVTLRVISPTNCDSSLSKTITVISSPNADFTVNHVCLNNQSVFVDQSTPALNSSISQWEWVFGDGDTIYNQNATHVYDSSGIYQALLTVTSPQGCIDTISKLTTIYALPDVNFSFTKPCTDQPIQFTDSSTSSNGSLTNWFWNFGTGNNFSNQQNPTLTYSDAFAYSVTLTASSSFGCVDSFSKVVIINQSPEFTIRAPDNCISNATQFQYIPNAGSSTFVGYLWQFGDLISSSTPNPQHVYLNSGAYNVSLAVTNFSNFCTTTLYDTVNIYDKPIANFASDSSCINKDLQLFDLSSIPTGSIQTRTWTFGSFGNSNLQNPIINISTAGSITTKLLVVSNEGCRDSISKVIEINSLPISTFSLSTLIGSPPLLVECTPLQSGNSTYWEFGDGSSPSTVNNPQHLYQDTGSFVISLISTSSTGCIDSSKRSVYVLIPYIDLSLQSINFIKENDYWKISARIGNLGNQDVTNYAISARLDEKSEFNERFINDTIKSGQDKLVTFKTRFPVDINDNPQFLCLDITEAEGNIDDNINNNKKCIVSTNQFELISTYPNPFDEQFTLDLNIPIKGKVNLKVFNTVGQKLFYSKEIDVQKGYNSIQIAPQLGSAGIYILNIKYGDDVKVLKIMKF